MLISTLTFAQTGPGGVGSSLDNRLWLKSDVGTSTTVDDDLLIQWDDQSGNNRHATIPVGINQPKYKSGIINGKPIVRFDGTNDFMNLDAGIEGD
ncbi:MAG: hypothetical protein A2033_10080 [Bacteroidetes bacterium GWA2_31_9]|nr:MAG: hypothetical protein A2033_10080 [Bacteroidetes bacterium GWA2_31_9]